MRPKAKTWTGFVVTVVLLAVALMLTAGTANYWQLWTFLGVVVACGLPFTLYVTRTPALLDRRIRSGPTAEKRPIQQLIVSLFVPVVIAGYVVPVLDHRLGWSRVPPFVSMVGDLLIALSLWMCLRVVKANSFASATIEIAKDQRVISTGPYAIVRHPMYSGASLYFVAMPLALGSYWGLIASVLTILGLVWRLTDEERFLAQNLPGYAEYRAKVRWRLIPGVF